MLYPQFSILYHHGGECVLVHAAVFKIVGTYREVSSVGSIPSHLRQNSRGSRIDDCDPQSSIFHPQSSILNLLSQLREISRDYFGQELRKGGTRQNVIAACGLGAANQISLHMRYKTHDRNLCKLGASLQEPNRLDRINAIGV